MKMDSKLKLRKGMDKINPLVTALLKIGPFGTMTFKKSILIFEFVKHLSNNHMIARRNDYSIF